MINCKVELKLKWTKHCVLATGGNDNDDANSNNIICTIKDTKLKGNQKLSKLLSKIIERSVTWKKYKTKNENKNTTNEYR